MRGGWALKVAEQFAIWWLVTYKPVTYKKISVIPVDASCLRNYFITVNNYQ